MIHYYDLNPSPFNFMKNGLKDIEIRLYDAKRKLLKPNDIIVFTNNKTFESIIAKVLYLHVFDNFEELYKNFEKTRLGYLEDDVADYNDMLAYYSLEKQKRYQALGIELDVINYFPEHVRFAKLGDLDFIKNLLHQVLDIHNEIRPDYFSQDLIKYRDGEIINLIVNKQIIVYDDHLIKGYLMFCIQEHKEPHIILKKELYIDDLSVEEDSRGKGIGKTLYNGIKQYAKDLGCNFVNLSVWEGNKALDFYKSLGLRVRKYTMEEEI